MNFLQNSLIIGALRDVLSGEILDWSFADWLALPQFALLDLERIAIKLLLDHTDFGRAIETEVLLRRSLIKARAVWPND